MISLTLDEKTEKLRNDFRSWLKSNPPPEVMGRIELEEFVEISTLWQSTLAADGWVAVHWPEKYGGRGLSLVDEAVIQECLAEASSPQLINLFGLTMVGPVLIKHGTEEQRERFLSKILSADEIWCQGFSEPEAGSDLASVRTVATTSVGSNRGWQVSGQKTWTSFAQYADWCFLLARTNTEVSKHQGLSYLLVPMKDNEGIDVRPLTQISRDREFNEVFFDKVETAAENLVGEEGQGWEIAISTLMYERLILTFARHLQSEQLLIAIQKQLSRLGGYKAEKREFAVLKAKSMALRAMSLSHLVQYKNGVHPGPEGSLDKLSWSENFQKISELGFKIQGTGSLLAEGEGAPLEGFFQHQYLYSRGRTIAAGTSEIQRDIIAERVLGLSRHGFNSRTTR